jgi:hypothetical protein
MNRIVSVEDEDSGIVVTIPISSDALASVADIQDIVRDVFYSAIKSIEMILDRRKPKKVFVKVKQEPEKPPELVHVRLRRVEEDYLDNIFLDSE